MKVLRIDDDLHKNIKSLAEKERRTINAMAEMLLERAIRQGVPSENTPLPKNIDTSNLPDSMVDNLFEKSEATPVEQACCLNDTKPCKHWKWDTSTGEGYVNILSGRLLEVE